MAGALMNNLNKLLLITLALLLTARLNAGPIDDMYREALNNEMIILYQIETGIPDRELVEYNKSLRRAITERCAVTPRQCKHIKLKIK